MRYKLTPQWIISVILLLVCIVPFVAMADEDPGPCPDCPIDGGLSVLLAAGVGYGVKKYREAKKKSMEAEINVK